MDLDPDIRGTQHPGRQLPRVYRYCVVLACGDETVARAATLEAFGDSIAKSSPLGRIGRADDMAGVAVYLASRAGSYVTGAVIPVDGGIATTS